MFFIFLYQRYIYRVDHSRVNEFGFSGDMLDENKKEDENVKSIKSPKSKVLSVKSLEDKKKD